MSAENAPEKETTAAAHDVDIHDDFVSTEHTLSCSGGTIEYTATSGRMVLRQEVTADGVHQGFKPQASMFVTSYVAKNAGKNRPVTFAFNGGPGSSSVWLHLGLLGPRRVNSGDVGAMTPPPYGLLDNPESILRVSDLVMIDPMSTGLSRVVEGGKEGDYHGFKADIELVGALIRLWVTRNERWLSPKYMIGESYGTTRACGLADYLINEYGMYLNGLMLVSGVLDFGTLQFSGGNDRPYLCYLPTYAATAWYHGKHPGRELKDVVAEAEDFCDRDYPYLLQRGNRLQGDDRHAAISKIAGLAGVSEQFVDLANLRIEHFNYFTELLRDQRLNTGRIDTRFTGPAANPLAQGYQFDPFMSAATGSYTAAMNHYLTSELSYKNDQTYNIAAWNKIKNWSYAEFEGSAVYVVDKLEAAMRANPDLQIQVAYGYFDGATPHYAMQEVIAHLDAPADRFEHHYYEAGHMMYIHEPSRIQQSNDIAAFIERSSK